ncbi:MAG: S-layer homology domain-containing protein [Candidatus Gracilibacteria bacterium]|nr:S-layer homology domain-containing protein [Candidatus Gracilibacteria bacterium]
MKMKIFLALAVVGLLAVPIASATFYTAPTNYDLPAKFNFTEIPNWFDEGDYDCPKSWSFEEDELLYDVDTLELDRGFAAPKGEGEDPLSGVVTTLTSRIGVRYTGLNNFTEVAEVRSGDQVLSTSYAPVTYTLSPDGRTWYYFNETHAEWQQSTGHYEQSSTAVVINEHLDEYNSEVGAGLFFFKAYLRPEMGYEEGESSERSWGWWDDWFGFGSELGMGWKIYEPYLDQVWMSCALMEEEGTEPEVPTFEELDLAHVFDEIENFSWTDFFNGWVAEEELTVGIEECTAEGDMYALYPGALLCCEGLVPIGPMEPLLDGNCPDEPIVGAAVCTACGDEVCGLGENKCNCPSDCVEKEPVADFDDVSSAHPNYEAIMALKEDGIIQGIGTLFFPDKVTTRAEAFKIALGGKVDVSGYNYVENPFVDLSDDHTLKAYVLYLHNQGVISGYDDTHVGPDNPLTVAEAAKVLLNLNEIELEEVPTGITYGLPSESSLIPYVHTAMEKGTLYFGTEDFDPAAGKLRGWIVEDMYGIMNLE